MTVSSSLLVQKASEVDTHGNDGLTTSEESNSGVLDKQTKTVEGKAYKHINQTVSMTYNDFCFSLLTFCEPK